MTTLAQSMAALKQANVQRAKAANIKRQLFATRPKSASLRLLAELLIHTESAPLGSMQIEDAILACFHVGAFSARKIMRRAELTGRVRIRDLSPKRRERFAAALLEHAGESSAVAA